MWLLDGSVLVALVLDGHVHHRRATSWFGTGDEPFATCSVTQGTLLRLHMLSATDRSAQAAWRALGAVTSHRRHVFWDCGLGYEHVPHWNLQGHKQVTDAWLAEIARRRGGRLATFDAGLAELHADIATVLPELD